MQSTTKGKVHNIQLVAFSVLESTDKRCQQQVVYVSLMNSNSVSELLPKRLSAAGMQSKIVCEGRHSTLWHCCGLSISTVSQNPTE